jgi:hypothetical protein
MHEGGLTRHCAARSRGRQVELEIRSRGSVVEVVVERQPASAIRRRGARPDGPAVLEGGSLAEGIIIVVEVGPHRPRIQGNPRRIASLFGDLGLGSARPMKLYGTKVPSIAQEVVRALISGKDIELEDPSAQKEVVADVESVLKSYLETERVVDEKTRELLQRTQRGAHEFGKVREQIGAHHGIKVGDEALDYLLDQVVQMLMHSSHVDEVFAEDVALRRRMAPIFKKHMAADTELEAEVRAQLKHVREGTAQWDVEYARVLDQVRRRRGLG